MKDLAQEKEILKFSLDIVWEKCSGRFYIEGSEGLHAIHYYISVKHMWSVLEGTLNICLQTNILAIYQFLSSHRSCKTILQVSWYLGILSVRPPCKQSCTRPVRVHLYTHYICKLFWQSEILRCIQLNEAFHVALFIWIPGLWWDAIWEEVQVLRGHCGPSLKLVLFSIRSSRQDSVFSSGSNPDMLRTKNSDPHPLLSLRALESPSNNETSGPHTGSD